MVTPYHHLKMFYPLYQFLLPVPFPEAVAPFSYPKSNTGELLKIAELGIIIPLNIRFKRCDLKNRKLGCR